MRAFRNEISSILARQEGVIARRDHPELESSLAWLHRKRALVAVLPGVYSPPSIAQEVSTRMRAAMLWAPEAVLIESAAAKVSFWSNIALKEVTLAVGDRRSGPPGFRLVRRSINPDLVRTYRGLRLTDPALTALDLCEIVDGDGIDTALRARAATLAGMHKALELSRYRAGNALRRRLLLDSRDQPWSAAERLGHRLLRQAGITGWRGNLGVRINGQLYYIDVAFERLMLAIEIDGRLHEDDQNLFESDRWRQNALTLQGWVVLRFTWDMLTNHPEEVVRTIRRAIAQQTQTQLMNRNVGPVSRSGSHVSW